MASRMMNEMHPPAHHWRSGVMNGLLLILPPGMIDAMETLLVDLGVPPARIHSERFRYRFGSASPLARRTRRLYVPVAGILVLAAVMFAAAT